MTSKERLQARADWVARYVNSNSRKGIAVHKSIKLLSNHILFISIRTAYSDLERGRKRLELIQE